jgi:hypothetical protein
MKNIDKTFDFTSVGTNNKKTQIILTETKREYKKYIQSLRYRYNEKNPYLPNYVISKSGEVIKIIDPKEYSCYMENETIDKNSIIISLENFGWLKKNPLEETYSNWIGDITKNKVLKKKWREYYYWDIYSSKQIKSLVNLVIDLCQEFNIPKECIGNNVKQDNVENFKGIVSRSNFNFYNKDVNPSFDFKLFKQQLNYDK